jgi:DNA modification methylase
MNQRQATRVATYDIFNIDAFVWLTERKPSSIHAVVTDPPFGIIEYSAEQLAKKRSGNGGIWRLPQNYDGGVRSPMPRFTVLTATDHKKIAEFHSRLAALLIRVLVPGGTVIMSSQNLLSHMVISGFIANGFELRGQIARIVKTLRGGDRPKGAHEKYQEVSVTPRSCWEPWLIFRKPCDGLVRENLEKWGTGALRRPHRGVPMSDLHLSTPARAPERNIAPHPSLKPQAFLRKIVWASLPLGRGIVLDPFMGSGSSIAAAAALGYRSIGLELDHEFFQMAQRAIPKFIRATVKE